LPHAGQSSQAGAVPSPAGTGSVPLFSPASPRPSPRVPPIVMRGL